MFVIQGRKLLTVNQLFQQLNQRVTTKDMEKKSQFISCTVFISTTCGNGLKAYWIMTNQLVNIRWFSSWCGYLGNVLFGIYTNAVDSIKLGGGCGVPFALQCQKHIAEVL